MKNIKFRQGVIIDGTKELEILINHLSGLSDHYSWKDLDNIRFYKKNGGQALVYVDSRNNGSKLNPNSWNLVVTNCFVLPKKNGMPIVVRQDDRTIVIDEVNLNYLVNDFKPTKNSLKDEKKEQGNVFDKVLDNAFESEKEKHTAQGEMFNPSTVWVSPNYVEPIDLSEEQKDKILNYIKTKKEITLSLSPDNTIDENKDIFQRWLAKTYHSKIVEDTKKRLHVTIFKHKTGHEVSLYNEDASVDIPSFSVISQEELETGFLTILKEEGEVKSDENTFKIGNVFSLSSDSRVVRASTETTEVIA